MSSSISLVTVELGARSYPILIGNGALADPQLAAARGAGRCLVVSDDNVAPLYAQALLDRLGLGEEHCLVLPAGEQHKHMQSFALILERMATLGLRRDGCVIALGGGVVGDLTGFAAASYMRGINFIQCPTTLLAMVDSSVGGKTGLNLPAGKNLVGAFWQPRLVAADVAMLASLSDREYRAGLAEVVKYGAIADERLFAWLELNVAAINQREPAAIEHMVAASCSQKAAIVARDELESGERALLNFGHTFGHALEAATEYRTLLHGEAVAIGMRQAARLSTLMGLAEEGDEQRLAELLSELQLPTEPPKLPLAQLRHHLALDKKAVASGLKFILWRGIGRAEIYSGVPDELLNKVLEA